MNRILAEHGQPTYLRLLSEMNNANNPYSAYDLSGNSRGRAFSTREFISYYQSGLLKPEFRLSTHPRSRAELRRQLSSFRYLGYAPEYRP